MTAPDDQGATYAAYVATRLDSERNRTERLETRSATVTTSSAALVGLVGAILALVLGKDYQVTSEARYGVLATLALLIASAVLALAAGLLRRYVVPDKATLASALGEHWTDTEVRARLACAWMDLDTLLSLRRANSSRTWWLDWALRVQLLGAVAFAGSVGWELFKSM